MDDWIFLLLAIIAGLVAALVWATGWGPALLAGLRQGPRGETDVGSTGSMAEIPLLPAHWQRDRAVERLIDRQEELEFLLETLGFSSRLERRLAGLQRQLRAATKVEIPDFEAFNEALGRASTQLSSSPELEPEALRQQRLAKAEDPLLLSVLGARDERDRVLELMGADPIDALLPFIEEFPFHRDGEVIWRTPIDLTVVRKIPADSAHFDSLLGELEAAVEEARIERPPRATGDLRDAIARARRGVLRPDVYLPTLIHGLEAELASWLAEVPEENRRRRARLFAWLGELLGVRERYGLSAARDAPYLRGDALVDFKRSMQQSAQSFLREAWMHGPWLRSFVLSGLVASELAGLAPSQGADSPRSTLGRVLEEVASGLFDGEETIARLHRFEARGAAIHSLIFALLRGGEGEAPILRLSPPGGAAASSKWPARAGGMR